MPASLREPTRRRRQAIPAPVRGERDLFARIAGVDLPVSGVELLPGARDLALPGRPRGHPGLAGPGPEILLRFLPAGPPDRPAHAHLSVELAPVEGHPRPGVGVQLAPLAAAVV